MPDSVAYMHRCYCGYEVYAKTMRDYSAPGRKHITEFYPQLNHPDPHDPVEDCPGCGRNIEEVEEEQYDDAMGHLP